MRVLVVGGAGFLGSHLVDRLLAEGHAVDVIDDLSSGSLANLAEARAARSSGGTISGDSGGSPGALKFHNLDVRVPELGDLLMRLRPDVAVHLALPGSGPTADLLAEALGGTANLLDAAARSGTGKIVVGLDGPTYYGHVSLRDLPVKEGALGPARSPASIAQRAVADLLALYREQRALEYTALAFGSVYGPRQRADRGVVAAFLAARRAGRAATVVGDGHQTRDFVAVDDAVDALVRSTTRGTGLVVNIGTGVQTSIGAMHGLVCGTPVASATRVAGRDDEIGRFALSPVRARIHLAWAPWTPVADGVAALLAQPVREVEGRQVEGSEAAGGAAAGETPEAGSDAPVAPEG
jgi:UDP-glucose 4-epimerase